MDLSLRALALAALLLPVPLPALAAAPDLLAASRVDAVTVHLSGARVTRLARVELPAGDSRVVLAGLPAGLQDDTIRVEGKGAARAQVFGVAVDRVTGEWAAAAEARAAEERLLGLQDADRALEDRIKVAQARQKFVESLRSTYADERARNLAVRGVPAREWADLAAFVERELSQAGAEVRRAEAGRRDAARRIEAARAEVEKLQAKRAATTASVAVELHAERAGALELAVTYTVPGASWEPVWDARLEPERKVVELALLGAIRNRSGEDWKDVRLAVSTADPGRGLLVPRLEPRWLSRLEPRPLPATEQVRRKAAFAAAAPPAPVLQASAADALEEKLAEPQAAVQEGLLAATFVAPRRESVDGAGQARRIALSRFSLPAEIARTAAPRVDPAAFLTARIANQTGVPLLAGTAGVHVGDEYVGRAPLSFTPPGGELQLAFGADPRVEVERRVLERRHETAGIVSKDEVWRYRTRIAVKNRWGGPVAVRLLDLVPVSREKEVEVRILEGTTEAAEDPERPGVRVHELALAAREERVVEIRYQVRFPRGFPVAGLE
jgi:uncharacterized protein (TIGR02231 family)